MKTDIKKVSHAKKLQGTVISTKMAKTAVVKVDRVKLNTKYLKRFVVSKNYQVHDEKNSCQVGDKVVIRLVRPISKNKSWLLDHKLS